MNNNEKLPSSSIAKIVSQSSDSYLLNLTIEDKKIRFWSFDIDILNDKSCFDHPDYQIFIKYVDYPFNLLAKSTNRRAHIQAWFFIEYCTLYKNESSLKFTVLQKSVFCSKTEV